MPIIICEVKSSGPYQCSVFFRFNKFTRVIITRQKWVGGSFETPDDFSSWKNDYQTIAMGYFDVKKDEIIDIHNKFELCCSQSHPFNKPLKIGESILEEGSSSDKYHIEIPEDCDYSTINEDFVDH